MVVRDYLQNLNGSSGLSTPSALWLEILTGSSVMVVKDSQEDVHDNLGIFRAINLQDRKWCRPCVIIS